jgi:hypothetical protein
MGSLWYSELRHEEQRHPLWVGSSAEAGSVLTSVRWRTLPAACEREHQFASQGGLGQHQRCSTSTSLRLCELPAASLAAGLNMARRSGWPLQPQTAWASQASGPSTTPTRLTTGAATRCPRRTSHAQRLCSQDRLHPGSLELRARPDHRPDRLLQHLAPQPPSRRPIRPARARGHQGLAPRTRRRPRLSLPVRCGPVEARTS